ncbi:hypothetical protein PLESTB_001575900 [Pleodorina starrii]|uniref:Uncharacterized protein n=1 Tax=Pleodorina starrii TaxID=330485 RepID=A0A9W6F8D7_9CHLO|nr:hypothetical protein PLESTB_001575900 [Pleodorina starrii]GLC68982.1 hypothetical protein PLESTF_000766100 [Pleodorina starrii]
MGEEQSGAPPAGPQAQHDPTRGFLNKFCFGWMVKHVSAARKGSELDPREMGMPEENLAAAAYDKFAGHWAAEMKLRDGSDGHGSSGGSKPSLFRALRRSFGCYYMLAGLCKCGWSAFVICGAFYFVRSLLAHVNGISDGRLYSTTTAGWALMAGFTLDAWFLGLSLQRMGYICMQVGIRARAALVQAVTHKAFRLSSVRADQSAAIVNFVSSDIQKIYDGALEFHYLWTAPFEAAAILALLGYLTNDSMLPGLGVILLVLPLQYFFGYKIIRIKLANAAHVAERSSILQEVLPAIKLVKYYAWEAFFEERISEIRRKELRLSFWNATMKVVNIACVFCVPPLTAFVIFTAYEFQKARLVSSVAFTTLSLFNILRFPLVVLPKALRAVSEAHASLQRLEAFLVEDVPGGSSADQGAAAKAAPPGVRIDNAVYHHPSNPNWHLHIPRFEVRPGQVVAVVGRISSGKSSLVQAILGNMVREHGSQAVGGRISYVPQNPWLQNMSIRDNVMFGEAWQQDKYEAVIEACALGTDLQILPQGDQSKAGIRGVNFSGGQRQRVNLARCAYADADLVLLDNALSAVDHHTAHHIFDACIKGLFADKAVVLITHQIEFMPRCDAVAIMDEGRCLYFGKWNEESQHLLGKLLPITHLLHAAGSQEPPPAAPKRENKAAPQKSQSLQLTLAPTSIGKPAPKDTSKDAPRLTAFKAALIYTYYGNLALVSLCFLLFLTAQTTRQMSDFWVRWWVNDQYAHFAAPKSQDPGATRFYSLLYLLLVGLFYLTMIGRGATFLWWVLRSSENIRRRALHNVMHAPMGFFLVTPVGDLLLNFTKDQDIMDENLPDAVHFMGIYGLILLATTITVSVTINFFGAFTAALILATLLMLSVYLPAATALKKARATSGGQLVGLVAEVLEGLAVVQAFSKQEHFIGEAARRTDTTNAAVFSAESLNLWLAFWCDLIGACLVGVVSAFAVGMKDTLGSATVGLAFSNIIQMLVFYTWVVRFIAESISLFHSVEGLAWLADYVPHDGVFYDQKQLDGVAKSITLPDGQIVPAAAGKVQVVVDDAALSRWPATGNIRFEDVWMQYRLDAPWALKGVTFSIADGEKVGAVGRTGSGKSTTLLALYRMFELGRGRILVDGVDIASLSLKRLRTGLSIIPQEPVMFTGTVRSNLDPFGEYKDDSVLWEVLHKVGLESAAQHAGGLDGRVDGTGGKAWSLGQMQLVCLARAALRAVPILCLDEATAAMDPHTEAVVQETIRRVFTDRTTITIAHRLDTIIESDKVLVMEAGQLKEYDAPATLLADRGSMFSKLVDKSGPAAAAALRQLAEEHFATRQQQQQQ